MKWLEERERGPADRESTEEALRELYTAVGLDQPRTVIWLDSPFQGILADAVLHHQHGDSLFRGDEPRMFMALMVLNSQWARTIDGSCRLTPEWRHVPAGQRLRSRAAVLRTALQKYAQQVRRQGVPPSDLERILSSLPGVGKSKELRKRLPGWLGTLFAPTGNHRTVLPRAFSYDYATARGDEFILNFPRCMNLDEIAARVYAVEKLSKDPPSWFPPLRDLTARAGWVWPYDEIALLCPLPQQSLYDERQRLHCSDGPALRYQGGGAVHALRGEWVEPAATDLSAITPELVQSELDLKRKRLMLEQLGPGIIDDPSWPESLRQLSRMVFQKQYTRFTADHLSPGIAPWPPGLREPRSEAPVSSSAAPPQDGVYYSSYPCGQLRVVAQVSQGEVGRWLWLGEGTADGYLREVGPYAEQYYPDGRIEDFSPYDDTSPPELTDMPFAVWVESVINSLLPGGLVKPVAELAPVAPPPILAGPVVCPDPVVEAAPSSLEDVLSALGRQDDGFFSTRWNLRRVLEDELKLPVDLSQGLGFFGVAACRRLLTPVGQRSQEVYLRPRWDRPEAPTEAIPLETEELYRRVKEAARLEIERAEKYGKTPHWVKNLAQPSPEKLVGEGRLPVPIAWMPADRPLDPFWICQVGCQLMLRQEATRATELSEYLQTVEPESFFAAAGLAGALLQSPAVLHDGLPDPALAPHGGRMEEVEDLVAHLHTEPRLPPLRGETFPARVPLLHSLGEWVHRRATGQAPTARQTEIVRLVGSFFNLRSANFPSRLSALVKGEEHWELSYPVQGWPELISEPQQSEPDWFCLRRRFHTRTSHFLWQAGLVSLGPKDHPMAGLCDRVEAVFLFLATGGRTPAPPGDPARRLERPGPCRRFPHAGDGYLRLLEAARWALEPWRKGDEKLAMALAHHLLGAL